MGWIQKQGGSLATAYLRLWAAGTTSTIGSGLITAFMWIARATMMPGAGALLDRFGPKPVLIFTSMAQTVLPLALAALFMAGHPNPWAIALVETVAGALTGFDLPSRSTLFAALVPPEQTHKASILGSTAFSIAWIAGPLLAALFVGRISYPAIFIINAATFALVAVAAVLSTPRLLHVDGVVVSVKQRIVAGASALLSTRAQRYLVLFVALGVLLIDPVGGLLAPMGQLALHGGAWTNSALGIAMGIGMTAGLLITTRLSRHIAHERLFVWAMFTCVPATILYAQAPTLLTALVMLAFWGAVDAASIEHGSAAYLQHRLPAAQLGSATALFMTGWNLMFGLGCASSGVLAGWLGIRTSLTVTAVVFGLAIVIAHLVRPDFWRTIAIPATEVQSADAERDGTAAVH